jgi:arginyl-tRNA synthetase
MSVLALLRDRFAQACHRAFDLPLDFDPAIAAAKDPKFGDYQCNAALSLAKTLQQPPRTVAQGILDHVHLEDCCAAPEIAGPGFINIRLRQDFLAQQVQHMLTDDRLGLPTVTRPQRIIVDFSSPNIAKEMHVGHLRSTIIGDCLARILTYLGHDVLRLNHVGDWGTQFGMLITYLREACPEALVQSDALALGDLVTLYRAAKQRFDEDAAFRESARLAVVDLQSGEAIARQAWNLLCEQSRREFAKIYGLLDITLTERGESFYNPYLAAVVEDLVAAGLVQQDEGATCVFLEGFTNKDGKPLPLIVQKSDGGYNYATTDLAAVRYRITEDRADRILYVTDMGQSGHFAQVFQVAQRAGWVPEGVSLIHVPFGLVLGEDGKKFKTRSGDTVPLKSLLEEAIARAERDLGDRNPQADAPFIQTTAQVIGIAAVKYADLSQNRTSNYIFSYDKMLSLQGNTAPYLLYAYVRLCGIGRKGGIDLEKHPLSPEQLPHFSLEEPSELVLAKHLIQWGETIEAIATELLPNRLCQYLFELSQKFNQFFEQCPVLQAEEPRRSHRLALCQVTARTLKLGLGLLGIPTVPRM